MQPEIQIHVEAGDGSQPRISRRQKRRRQVACRYCRARKVKCDRRLPDCLRCEKLGIRCSYDLDQGPAPTPPGETDIDRGCDPAVLTQAGIKRRRIRRACQPCRSLKAKCSGGDPCVRCQAHGLGCVYRENATVADVTRADTSWGMDHLPSSSAGSGHVGGPMDSPDTCIQVLPRTEPQQQQHRESSVRVNPREQNLGDKALVRKCIDAFFAHADPCDCAILHKALLISSWNRGHADTNLLRVVCALGIRSLAGGTDADSGSDILDSSTTSSSGPSASWARDAHMSLLAPKALENPSTGALQALVLLVRFYFASPSAQDAWILLSVAARLAFTMRLNYERPCTVPLQSSPFDAVRQECLRRLMWAIFVFDKLFSGGIEDLSVCPSHRMQIRLPCSGSAFERGRVPQTPFLHEQQQMHRPFPNGDALDAVAHRIRLFELRERIFRYTRRVIADGSSPVLTRRELQALDDELCRFRDALPPELQLDPDRLMMVAHSGDSQAPCPYVILHCMWRLCRCDLHRLLIPGIREAVSPAAYAQTPSEYVDHCQRVCLESAAGILRLVSDVHDLYDVGGDGGDNVHIPVHFQSPSLAVSLYQSAQVLDRLAHRTPATGPQSIGELRRQLARALTLASHLGDMYQWLRPCIADIEQQVVSLGIEARRDSPATYDNPGVQDPSHTRSKHVFAPSPVSGVTRSPQSSLSHPTASNRDPMRLDHDCCTRQETDRLDSNSLHVPQLLPTPSDLDGGQVQSTPASRSPRAPCFVDFGAGELMFPMEPLQMEMEYYANVDGAFWPGPL